MKKKEIIQLSIAGIIFVVAGIVIFSQVSPNKGKSSAAKYTYEDVQPIKPEYDAQLLQRMTDTANVKDFYLPPDLKSGVGNQSPFKPIN